MRKLSILLLGLIIMASCGKKPESLCSADKTVVIVGEQIQFRGDQSTDAYYYHWKFGDGTESRDANPFHTFDKAGTFEVILHVSNKGGDQWSNNQDPLAITVYGYQSAFRGEWTIVETDSVQLCPDSSSVRNYTLTIREGAHENELILGNLGGRFITDITGYSIDGNPNQIGINQNDVIANNAKSYSVNGTITLDNNVLTLDYTLTPTGGDPVCGYIKCRGFGAKQ